MTNNIIYESYTIKLDFTQACDDRIINFVDDKKQLFNKLHNALLSKSFQIDAFLGIYHYSAESREDAISMMNFIWLLIQPLLKDLGWDKEKVIAEIKRNVTEIINWRKNE